jgi:hypothetical protein
MRATRTLPENYRPARSVDLHKDQKLLLYMNIAALVLLVFFGGLFFRAVLWLRAGDLTGSFIFQGDTLIDWLVLPAWGLGLMAGNVILHEAIHGIFFWLFTGERPLFALRLSYAYAAAPGWYLPRNAYLVTGLAPFVVISLAGLALIASAPASWLAPVWFVATVNAAGAVGDLAVAVWLLQIPPDSFAQDRGDAVTLYVRG